MEEALRAALSCSWPLPGLQSLNRFFSLAGQLFTGCPRAPKLCAWLEGSCRDESSKYQPQSQLLGTRGIFSLPHLYPEREDSVGGGKNITAALLRNQASG